ncbi:LysR family transcriptional regulator [Acetobacter oeni]|uniref:Transcriptional regulator n=1 Tax=Acetobacter oeni TaxID=304077 RepID=A0A511XNU5_9PROT|nr:LysR family transcriptional regulator [Acetobacter oeni]MBB3882611.1 DNA-binding transcriptional LysR family regulator [Acetobacter oeni]NHO18715.1 LysR family transcriptional regulator [Acetobacter oeni]GBR09018.1 transcriptional regulator [Acetobacter oeni LMG 21952]GEN64632.1 transcriptional regulator [Acetobacter oeni]
MQVDSRFMQADTISLRQLRLFEGVGRLKSIRRASEECNLSQPAVTQSIAKLESHIGVTLLDRDTNGSYLNQSGFILHRRTTRFFEQIEQAITELGCPGDRAGARAVARRLTKSQIRSLLLVAERVPFADAARIQGLSAASLQRTSRDLERNVGKQLYSRTPSGVIATPEGDTFGRRIRLAIQEIDLGLKEIDTARGIASTSIAIGAMPCGGSVMLASVLDRFVREFPQASVKVTSSQSSDMLARLLCGDVDIALGLIPETLEEEIQAQPLVRTPYEIVARRGHPLLHKGSVTIDDLAACDWIAGTPSSNRRAVFDQLFAGHEGPRAPITTCSMPVVRHLLTVGDRLTLMTSYERTYEGETLMPVPVPVSGPVPAIGVMIRRNWLPTRLHTNFIELLHRGMTHIQPPRLVAQTA